MSSLLFGSQYAAASVSDPGGGLYTALLLLSHLPMLYAVVYVFSVRLARLAVVALGSLLVSVGYHACRASAAFCLGVPVNSWRMCDHTLVTWVLGALGLQLLMTALVQRRSQFFFMVAGYLIFPIGVVAVNFFPYTVLSAMIMVVFIVIVALVRIVELACRADRSAFFAHQGATSDTLFLVYLLTGVCSAALGIVFFYLDDGAPGGNSVIDAVSHTLWHTFSGIALFCVSVATEIRTVTALRLEQKARVSRDQYEN